MALKGSLDFEGNKLEAIVGEVFHIDEKIVTQSDTKKIGKTIKILLIEID